jgi:arylsulfatase A-like enzyme
MVMQGIFSACRLPGVLLLFLIIGCGQEGASDKDPRPLNLILISIDTLRADHLGCYGYGRPTSPFLDSLVGRDGTLFFEQCISQASTTAPSHMTLFTSLHPTVHGIPNIPPDKGVGRMTLPSHSKTLATLLSEAGYRTAGIADGGYLGPVFGFKRGFETYACAYEGVAAKVDQAEEWLEKAAKAKIPFFLFLHTYEVHAPYLPPPPFDEQFTGSYDGWIETACQELESSKEKTLDLFAEIFARREEFTPEDVAYLIGLYDGEIAYTDRELERFWQFIEKKGILENTVVVILSDHGEEFGEHGEFSHKNLYDCVVHVPLILYMPPSLRSGIQRNRISDQVSLIDVMPTLLEMLGLERPRHLQGRSLVSLWEGPAASSAQPAFSTYIHFGEDPICHGIRLEGIKLLNYLSGQHFEVFDLSSDRGEQHNVVEGKKGESAELLRLLTDQHSENIKLRPQFKATPAKGRIDPAVLEELRKLGY